MTTTTINAPASHVPTIAASGIAVSAVLTALGTFWDSPFGTEVPNRTPHDTSMGAMLSDYGSVLAMIAAAAAVVFGLVVRGAGRQRPGRRSAVLGVLGLLSTAAFWSGLPVVLVAGSLAAALIERDVAGRFRAGGRTALVLAPLTVGLAVWLAITG